MKRVVNLADKKAAMELLKQLYGNDEVKDDQSSRAIGEARARMVGGMVEPPSNIEKILSQE